MLAMMPQDSKSIIKKQKRRFYEEELHQDILDAKQRNRFLEAYKKEKELHQLRLENLRIQLKDLLYSFLFLG